MNKRLSEDYNIVRTPTVVNKMNMEYRQLLTKILAFNYFCFIGKNIKFPYGLIEFSVMEGWQEAWSQTFPVTTADVLTGKLLHGEVNIIMLGKLFLVVGACTLLTSACLFFALYSILSPMSNVQPKTDYRISLI